MCKLSEFVIVNFKKVFNNHNLNTNFIHTKQYFRDVSFGFVTFSALSLPYYGIKLI